MSPAPRKTLILAGVLVVLNVAGAYLLDALGLVEGLLSPNGASVLYLVPLAALYYLIRFGALFVAPGLVLGAGVLWLSDRHAQKGR